MARVILYDCFMYVLCTTTITCVYRIGMTYKKIVGVFAYVACVGYESAGLRLKKKTNITSQLLLGEALEHNI
jgi:hypothetical protein